MSRWRPVLILPHFLDRAINSDCDISRTNLDVTSDINQLEDKLQSLENILLITTSLIDCYRDLCAIVKIHISDHEHEWIRFVTSYWVIFWRHDGLNYNSIHWERRGHAVVSVRPLTLMSPDDGRGTDTGGLSCDLLLRNRAVLCGGGSGGVGNFKCTKAHHRGQRQDTLIQPTRFCPPGVCLFKIS